MKKTQTMITHSGLLISVILCYIVFFLFSETVLTSLTTEDHFFEWTGTIFILASSIMFFITFLRSKKGNDLFYFKTKKNYFFLFLAILFFFAFGEELSWGQRIFNLQPDELINRLNDQQEFNIHNMKMFRGAFNANHLFTYFWVTFCVIIPILYRKSHVAAAFLNRINLPKVPFWLAMFFLLSYSISLILKLNLTNIPQAVSEVKETSISFLFVIFSIICLTENNH